MDKSQISVLGVGVTALPKADILEEVRKYLHNFQFSIFNFQLRKGEPLVIFTPNPEIINYAQKDDNFRRIVNTAQINIPDGWGVVWAAKKLYNQKLERIAGVDLVGDLAKMAEKEGYRIGLIGGKGKIAVEALECLKRKFPRLKGWAEEGPEIKIFNFQFSIFNDEIKEIVGKIQSEKTDILFVGLGCPKQEYFIDRIKNQELRIKNRKPLVIMAVGGAFDYISGRVGRAPVWMRNAGLEWFYRLIREPWRLGRQIRGAEFFWRVWWGIDK